MSSNNRLHVIILNLTQIRYFTYLPFGYSIFNPKFVVSNYIFSTLYKMLKYHKTLVGSVIKLLSILVISFSIASPASAITKKVQFNTESGYKVEAVFSYDQAKNPQVIREYGHGKTETIDSMKVSFYKSSGELIADYNNIVEGVVTGNYFEFNFDPRTQKFLGNLDIGGESSGEMYLKGKVGEGVSLIKVSESEEKEIDVVSQIMN